MGGGQTFFGRNSNETSIFCFILVSCLIGGDIIGIGCQKCFILNKSNKNYNKKSFFFFYISSFFYLWLCKVFCFNSLINVYIVPSVQCSMSSVQCRSFSLQFSISGVKVQIAKCASYSMQRAMYSMQFDVQGVKCEVISIKRKVLNV